MLQQVYYIAGNRDILDGIIKKNPKLNQVFGLLRVAVTSQTVSPALFESMEIVGKEKLLERLLTAIQMLEKLK
jgi:glutamyl-tRNA synthetase